MLSLSFLMGRVSIENPHGEKCTNAAKKLNTKIKLLSTLTLHMYLIFHNAYVTYTINQSELNATWKQNRSYHRILSQTLPIEKDVIRARFYWQNKWQSVVVDNAISDVEQLAVDTFVPISTPHSPIKIDRAMTYIDNNVHKQRHLQHYRQTKKK